MRQKRRRRHAWAADSGRTKAIMYNDTVMYSFLFFTPVGRAAARPAGRVRIFCPAQRVAPRRILGRRSPSPTFTRSGDGRPPRRALFEVTCSLAAKRAGSLRARLSARASARRSRRSPPPDRTARRLRRSFPSSSRRCVCRECRQRRRPEIAACIEDRIASISARSARMSSSIFCACAERRRAQRFPASPSFGRGLARRKPSARRPRRSASRRVLAAP